MHTRLLFRFVGLTLFLNAMSINKAVPESWFSEWFNSNYYDVLYEHRNDAEAEQLIQKLFEVVQPKTGSHIADIPCGNGRHARYIASLGFDVNGYDLSDKNIACAKKSESTHLHFAKHDMTQPFGANLFDYILNLFTSLGYFHSTHSDQRIIKNFYAALKPGGNLVIDYFNSNQVRQQLIPSQDVVRNDISFHIEKEVRGDQIIKHITVNDKGKVQHFAERVRLYTLADFTRMLHNAGFSMHSTYGDYEMNKFYETTSPRLLIIATK